MQYLSRIIVYSAILAGPPSVRAYFNYSVNFQLVGYAAFR